MEDVPTFPTASWQGELLPEGEPVLDSLKALRIMAIEETDNGYCITEQCDQYFGITLTREQMQKLIAELQDMIGRKWVDDTRR